MNTLQRPEPMHAARALKYERGNGLTEGAKRGADECPRVSVIIPTYNRAELVHQAVQSVIAQSWLDWELIVVDDGSTDETIAALKALGEWRLRVLPEAHCGHVARLRNIGAKAREANISHFSMPTTSGSPKSWSFNCMLWVENPDVGHTPRMSYSMRLASARRCARAALSPFPGASRANSCWGKPAQR